MLAESRIVDIWDRLECAQERFQEIQGMLRDYYRSCVGELRGQFDLDPEAITFVSDRVELPPPRLATVTGELLHDLRSGLEHLAWVLVEVNGGQPTDHTSFPILKTRPAANRQGIHPPPTVIGGVSPTAAALIDRAQPYQCGPRYMEHPLWVLHKLWNIDKHRHITLRGLRMDGFRIPEGAPPFTFTMRLESVGVDGAELLLVPDDPAVDVDTRTTVEVFVHEADDGVATALHGTLEHLIEATTTVVTEAERRCPLTVPARHHAAPPTG
jgi:hypothetical protein